MDPPLELALRPAGAPSAHALAAARLQAFAPPGAAPLPPGAGAAPAAPAAAADDLPGACAAAWDAAFGGAVQATPQTLAAASAQLRASAVGVCEDMQRLSAAAARGEGSGGGGGGGGASSGSGSTGGGEAPTAALLAFRAAVAAMAAQLEVLRRQEALAELAAHATGASEASGLRGAQASLQRLELALQALPL
jgi:hypothetical protein